MPKLSLKKILLVILAIVLLAYSGRIYEICRETWDWMAEGLTPLSNTPKEMRFVLTLLILALVFVVFYQLIMNRRK